ncbi:MAG: flagellar hook-length control protein FliK [Gammaproteobacteria bacterium]|nr:flagellar hook-length control protein FliK [Gammaproteobacteria bacterium]
MLPFIKLQSSDLATFSGETAAAGATTQAPAASTMSFNDLLRGRVPGSVLPGPRSTGQGLPPTGSELPGLTLAGPEPLRDLLPPGWRGDGPVLANDVALPLVPRLVNDLEAADEDGLRFAADVLPPFPVGPQQSATDQPDLKELAEFIDALELPKAGPVLADPAAAPSEPRVFLRDWPALREVLQQRGLSTDELAALEQGLKRAAALSPGGAEKDGQLPVVRAAEVAAALTASRDASTRDRDEFTSALLQTASGKPATGDAMLPGGGSQRPVQRASGAVPPSFAGLLNLPAQMPRIDTAATALPVVSIDVPVSDAEWGQSLNDRIMWMADNRLRRAEIRLHPAEMGPLRVKISVEEGTANVAFHAHHAVTREAIEQALPRLREMLAENGLAFGDASVSDGSVPDRQAELDHDHPSPDAGVHSESAAGNDEQAVVARRRQEGLVDTFA